MRCSVKKSLLALIAAVPSVLSATDPALQGIYDIVERRIPDHTGDFTFKLVNGTGDSFIISDTRGRSQGITVSCTTTSACARGLYTYVPDTSPVPVISHFVYADT